MKWPFDERPLCCTRDVVQPFSVAPHCRRILGASYTATSAVATDEKAPLRSGRLGRPIPLGRSCTTRKSGRLPLLLHSVQLFNRTTENQSLAVYHLHAHSSSPGTARHLSLSQRTNVRLHARVFAIERANWRPYCNRQSRGVVSS